MKKVKVNPELLKSPPTSKLQAGLWLAFGAIVLARAGYYWYAFTSPADTGVCPEGHAFPGQDLLNNKAILAAPGEYNEGPCYFSEGYDEATDLFLRSAALANADVYSLPVVGDLSTKVAVLKGNGEKYLVHLSGTHGVEAYSGSAIQSAVLQSLAINEEYKDKDTNSDLPTLIFIHSVNPFGFYYNRRVNEDNVDVNRNYLTEKEFEYVTNRDPNYAGYVDLDFLVNPTSKPFGDLHPLNFAYSLLNIAYVAVVKGGGISTIKKAMVSGNYWKSTGYGFGGFSKSKSAQNLDTILKNSDIESSFFNLPATAKRLAFLDVHSGLGPQGVDTLMTWTNNLNLGGDESSLGEVEGIGEGEGALKNLATAFPTEVMPDGSVSGGLSDEPAPLDSTATPTSNSVDTDDGTDVSKADKETASAKAAAQEVSDGYQHTVGVIGANFCQSLAPALSRHDRACITQEFGTLPSVLVGDAALGENFAFFHGSESQKAYYAQKMKDAFYVQSKFWKNNVVRRGLKVFYQALHAL